MASRDKSLDGKISAAALAEFSEKGFYGASVRQIAARADVTPGAIQSRYRSKDELFSDVLAPLLRDIEAAFGDVRADYYSASGASLAEGLAASMRKESEAILRLIFAHYDLALLLFTGSAGSGLEGFFDALVGRKISESLLFFEGVGVRVDEKLLTLLVSAQFDGYRRIVTAFSDLREAEKYMAAMMTFNISGWNALLAGKELVKELVKEDKSDEI